MALRAAKGLVIVKDDYLTANGVGMALCGMSLRAVVLWSKLLSNTAI